MRDDGYHLIDAEMVTLDWHDTLTIDPVVAPGLTADGPFADGHAARRLQPRRQGVAARRSHGRRCTSHKALPHGGGLGGGSADAAAVLRWAGLRRPRRRAPRLGADVPFCLVGGRARVRGIGEIVEPLPFEPLDITLVVPPLLGEHASSSTARGTTSAGRRGDGANDLEPAALSRVPELADWRDRIARRGRRRARRWPAAGRPGSSSATTIWHRRGASPHASWSVHDRTVRLDAKRPPAVADGRRRDRHGSLAALALVTGTTKHLLVLLLAHSLAAFLDQRTHSS